jgi:disulfide oxidoreductase YuzD
MQKGNFKEDMKRIKKADTKYPLIVIENEFDSYGGILDGNHRFAKLIMNNSKKVKFNYISRKELDKFMVKV